MRIDREMARLMAVVLCAGAVAASAEASPILNESFEDGAFVANAAQGTMTLNVGSTAITNGTVVADALAWIESPNPWFLSAQDGDKFLDLTNFQAGAPFGGVTQTIATDVGASYDLLFYLGSYTARWGGPPVAITATAGSASQTCTVSSTSTMSTWTLCTVPFVALSTSTAVTLVGAAGVHYIGLDNVTVEQRPVAAPEPGAMILFGAGLAGLISRARRRR